MKFTIEVDVDESYEGKATAVLVCGELSFSHQWATRLGTEEAISNVVKYSLSDLNREISRLGFEALG